MASQKHQFILGLVVKKMRLAGCRITAVDGRYPGLLGAKLPLPPTIIRHRPDIMGLLEDGQICIGEAKTEEDALSVRTMEQLADFSTLELNDRPCEVFVGVPAEAEDGFRSMLKNRRLDKAKNIHVLYVPNEIISG